MGDENSNNMKVVEKFIPSFKNTKNNGEEGKEKILKKIKESFDKCQIKYTEGAITEILIKDGNIKNNYNYNKKI